MVKRSNNTPKPPTGFRDYSARFSKVQEDLGGASKEAHNTGEIRRVEIPTKLGSRAIHWEVRQATTPVPVAAIPDEQGYFGLYARRGKAAQQARLEAQQPAVANLFVDLSETAVVALTASQWHPAQGAQATHPQQDS